MPIQFCAALTHVPSGVWTLIYRDFNINSFAATMIPSPSDPGIEVNISETMLEAMAMCHNGNPCVHSCTAFASELQNTSSMTRQELWGVLQACAPSPMLPEKKSYKMIVAVFDYWVKHDVIQKEAEWFEIMEDCFDVALCFEWREHVASKLPRICFIKNNAHLMEKLIPGATVNRLIEQSLQDWPARKIWQSIKKRTTNR